MASLKRAKATSKFCQGMSNYTLGEAKIAALKGLNFLYRTGSSYIDSLLDKFFKLRANSSSHMKHFFNLVKVGHFSKNMLEDNFSFLAD